MLTIKKRKERVILVGVLTDRKQKQAFEESLSELKSLVKTASAQVVDVFSQFMEKPKPSTYIGKGKIVEIKALMDEFDDEERPDTIIFNNDLSPAQSRNLANEFKCKIVDRTELILDIFALHARTKQAKLQVELAQMEYNYSRLKNLWGHLSRIQGGIGFRGPGEKQIEVDRREIQNKITQLKRKLKLISKHTETKRSRRRKAINLALIGYTNAGKSTLFNQITNGDVYAANELFATLDATTRSIYLSRKEQVVITDTIGFIKDLPHTLVESFHSTLMEVLEADLLLHVVDVSHPFVFDQISAVEEVLEELGAVDKDILMVFNKIDKVQGVHFKFLKKKLQNDYPQAIFISAKEKENIEELYSRINFFLSSRKAISTLRIPYTQHKLLNFIYSNSTILEDEYDEVVQEHVLKVNIDRSSLNEINKKIEELKYKNI